MVRTLAERAFERGELRRPTDFVPNGCGSRRTGIVPDSLVGVDFGRECCNAHDLAYHRGGFLDLFWRKPAADVGLGACMAKRFHRAARARWRRGERLKAAGTELVGALAAPAYTAAVLAVGWLPFIWPWSRRPDPSHKQLVAVERRMLRA